MSLKNEILTIMMTNAGNYISGEELARRFNKSRAAVWKSIKSLRSEGYTIDAVTNKGYLLTDDNDLLSPCAIKSKMKNKIGVLYYPVIDSTNNEAKRLIAAGHTEDMLIVAQEQTAGRGRQGKSFYSPAFTGVYMTIVIHPDILLQNAVTTTTAAGVAVCRAIEKLCDKRPMIKWVNDVYLDDKKICGILTECVSDFETGNVSSIIIGIGTNIRTADFPQDVENAASLNADVKRNDLIACIADEMLNIACGEYISFINYYRSHSLIIGREIFYIENGKRTAAKALAIDEQGGLIVEREDGTTLTLRSGDISIRWQ